MSSIKKLFDQRRKALKRAREDREDREDTSPDSSPLVSPSNAVPAVPAVPSMPSLESPTKIRKIAKAPRGKSLPPLLPVLPNRFKHLEEHGYQVIPNVFTAEKCEEIHAALKQWYVDVGTGVDFNDAKTWKSENLPYTIHGIHQNYSVGQIQPVWDVRQDPQAVNVFAELWNASPQDMLSSFDGFCLQPPHEWLERSPPARKGNHSELGLEGSWYHYDQRRAKVGRHCIQGFITLQDQDHDDATLMVLAGSHKYHQAFFQQFDKTPEEIKERAKAGDWIKFNQASELKWVATQPGVKEVRVVAPKGSLVLWDSRTAHCSGKPHQDRPHPHWRSLVYTCYQPRRLATPKDLARKQTLFNTRRTSNHWAATPKAFPKEPRFGKKSHELNVRDIPAPVLTDLGKRLAGF